jgi:hypothetical protein
MTVIGGRTSLVDLALSSVTNTAGDFLTLSGGVVHKRTAAQTLTDIGGQAALTNPVTGTGTSGQVAYFTGTTNLTSDSDLLFDGSNLTVGGNITLSNGANRFVRIGSSTAYYYDLQTVGDDFQIREAGTTPRLTFTYPTGAATFSSTITAATLSTIGTAVAGQNVQLNLNGVSGKAQRIEFQNSGVQQWLIGAGAASETSAFEIFNSTGIISLSINKSTNAATFSNSVSVAGLNLGSTYASKLGVYNSSSAANMELGTATNTNGTIVSRATFYNVNNGNTGNESSANFIGVASIETQLVTANGNASGTSGGTIIFKTKRDGGTLDNTLTLSSTGAATFVNSVTAKDGSLFNANSATLTQDVLTVRGGGVSGAFGFRVEANNGDDLLFVNALSYSVIMGATGGNVLIGTTTDGTQKLRVAGITRVTKLVTGEAGLSADNYTEFSNDDNVGYINTNRVVNNGDFHFRFDGTSRANINRTTGVYLATSDFRLKSKIENSQSAMPLINQIKVRQYQWNESSLFENFGFIAQELEEILPDYVHKPINDNDFWKISKSELVPLLVKAIQELKQEIDTLKN